MDRTTDTLCPEQKLMALLALAKQDEAQGTRNLDGLIKEYPGDARLHFLKGSFLAGAQDYVAARSFMRRAVDLAPDYAIARFQLGFLLLTSGEPHAAQEAWGPLHALPNEHYLHTFVLGLGHLIHDDFGNAVKLLQEGMKANTENPVLNRDMQLIVDEISARPNRAKGAGPTSSVDFLLQQAALRATRH